MCAPYLLELLPSSGDSVHIDTALVDVSDGSELWGEGYDRKLSEIGNLQQEIARDISSKLQLRLSSQMESAQEKIPPQDSEAYLLYLRGRYYLDKQTTNDVRTSIDYFQQAISRIQILLEPMPDWRTPISAWVSPGSVVFLPGRLCKRRRLPPKMRSDYRVT